MRDSELDVYVVPEGLLHLEVLGRLRLRHVRGEYRGKINHSS